MVVGANVAVAVAEAVVAPVTVAVAVAVVGDDLCRWTVNKRPLDRPNNSVRRNDVRPVSVLLYGGHATKTGAKLTAKATNDGA